MHPSLKNTLATYESIVLVGGGTGGHIQPILSIVSEFRSQNGSQEFLWIGGKDSQEEAQARENKIPFESIPTLKLTTTKSPKILLYPFVLLQGILEARKILRKRIDEYALIRGSGVETVGAKTKTIHGGAKPEGASFLTTETFGTFSHESTERSGSKIAVFSKGGPGSVALGIAAWTLRIPLYIHESDTIPGRSNALLGKIATKIFLGFESATSYFNAKKCEVIGQILDPVFSGHCELTKQSRKNTEQKPLNRSMPRDDENTIHWKTDKKHILVICGSQGARSVFRSILEQFGTQNPYEWIISLGKLNRDMQSDFEHIENINAVEWLDQKTIASLLAQTDIAISRGSATTLAEIDTFPVRKIIIPLPSAAKNHQYWNAREYEKTGDILLEQKHISQLTQTLETLGQNSAPSKKS